MTRRAIAASATGVAMTAKAAPLAADPPAKRNGNSRRPSCQMGIAVFAISVAVYRRDFRRTAHRNQNTREFADGARSDRDAKRAEYPRPNAHRRRRFKDAQHMVKALCVPEIANEQNGACKRSEHRARECTPREHVVPASARRNDEYGGRTSESAGEEISGD
jgi:hypothetical protein